MVIQLSLFPNSDWSVDPASVKITGLDFLSITDLL